MKTSEGFSLFRSDFDDVVRLWFCTREIARAPLVDVVSATRTRVSPRSQFHVAPLFSKVAFLVLS